MRPLLALIAALGALTLPAAASAGIPLDLADYDDTALRFDGELYPPPEGSVNWGSDSSGAAVAGDCDVTGDGQADLIVGAPTAMVAGLEVGRVYVVPGGSRLPGGYSLLAAAGGAPAEAIVIAGETASARQAGAAVDCAGDVDGDGADDVLLGAASGSPSAGRGAYVIFGGEDLVEAGTVGLDDLGEHGFAIRGGGGSVGTDVAGVGDLDGDGRDEVAVSSPTAGSGTGLVYVVGGRTATTAVDLALPESTLLRIAGPPAEQLAQVDLAGDVNGDDVADLVVGAWRHDGPNGVDAGAAYLIGGAVRGAVSVAGEEAPVLFRVDGAAAGRRTGWGVAGVGDVDGDGLDDVALVDSGAQPVGDDSFSTVSVVYGKAGTGTVDLAALGAGGFVIAGPPGGTVGFGDGLAAAGDVNGDERSDLLIGAPGFHSDAGPSAGAAYLIHGGADLESFAVADMTCEQGARLWGDANALRLGRSVAAAGDFTGTGLPQVAIGVPAGSGVDYGNYVKLLSLADVEGACEDDEPEPPAPVVEIDWGLRENFRRYVSNGFDAANPATPIAASAGAFCDANPDVARGGCDPKLRVLPTDPPPARALRWTPVGAGKTDGSDTTVAAQGRVTFRYPGHYFTFRLEDPWFVIDGGQVTVRARVDLDVDPSFPAYRSTDVRVELGTFPLAGAPTVTAEHVQWRTGDGVLTEAAGQALGGFLGAGAVLDPVTITIPRSLGELPDEPTVPVVVDPPGGGGTPPGSDGPKPPGGDRVPAKRPRWSIPARTLKVAGGKPVVVATVRCGSGACRIGAPRTTVLRIGRRRFKVRVLAPRRIASGKRGKVRVRLTKAARAALGSKTGRTSFEVTVRENGRTTKKRIAVRYAAERGKTGSAS